MDKLRDLGGKIKEGTRETIDNSKRSIDEAREKASRWAEESRQRAQREADEAKQKAFQYEAAARERAKQAAEEAQRRYEEEKRKAAETARNALYRGKEAFQNTSQNLKNQIDGSRSKVEEGAKQFIEEGKNQVNRFNDGSRQIFDQKQIKIREEATRIKGIFNSKQEEWKQAFSQRIEEGKAKKQSFIQTIKDRWEGEKNKREAYLHNLSERAANVINQYGEKAQHSIEIAARKYSPVVTEVMVKAYQEFGKEFGDEIAEAFLTINSAVKDPKPENLLLVGLVIIKVQTKLPEYQKRAFYAGLRTIAKIEVGTPDGGKTSIESFLRDVVIEKIPSLQGTKFAEDPADFVLYGFVDKEPEYFFKDLKIINSPKGNGKVSMNQALAELSDSDPEKVLEVLEIMEGCETLNHSLKGGELPIEAVDHFQKALTKQQKDN